MRVVIKKSKKGMKALLDFPPGSYPYHIAVIDVPRGQEEIVAGLARLPIYDGVPSTCISTKKSAKVRMEKAIKAIKHHYENCNKEN